jgi:succinate-semialdehyde dehydrogenase/glutarate-semialdehyde dehydrogenase
MTLEDTRKAVDVAHETFKTFRNTTPAQRQGYLAKMHDLFQENLKDIARLIVWENGKSWNDAIGEAAYAASYINWFAGEAVRAYGQVVPSSVNGTRNIVIKQPVGVCSLLVPYAHLTCPG